MAVENILADLIRIESVNPPGGETAVAEYLKHLFDQAEIPNEIIEPSPGRGSFIAHLGDGERRLLYLSHTDVVPVTEGWSFAPFGGEIKDGFVRGRGALDCKGLVAAEAWAVISLARQARLGGRLIFAATADEEAGGKYGVKYLVERCRDKIAADFTVNEGAQEPVRIGGRACHFLQVGEKGAAWTRLKAKGISCHGSVPGLGDNAVVKMARAINRLAEYQPEITLIPEVRNLIQKIAQLEGGDIEVNAENIDRFLQGLEDRTLAEYLRAITRMTVSPNAIHGGAKTNIVPDSCEADIDIRVLPGQDEQYIVGELDGLIGDVEMEIPDYSAPSFSGRDSRYYQLISDVTEEVMDNVTVLPCMSSGATDSRFLRKAGIPSYGIGIMAKNLDPGMRLSVHGRDERIDVESLRLKSDFLVRLARKYLGELE